MIEELQLSVSDDMQAVEPVQCARPRTKPSYTAISRAEWTRGHKLLLAQALALILVGLVIREQKAV